MIENVLITVIISGGRTEGAMPSPTFQK